MRMSSASMFPYFCIMSVRSSAQSTGAGYSLRNHSFARPRRFNLAILNNLSRVRSRTSAAMVNRSAQSVTSSYSRPQNKSSKPCGLAIFLRFCNNTRMQQSSPPQSFSNKNTVANKATQNPSFCISVMITAMPIKHCPSHIVNSDCAPSWIGLRGSKLDGTIVNLCSSVDSSESSSSDSTPSMNS